MERPFDFRPPETVQELQEALEASAKASNGASLSSIGLDPNKKPPLEMGPGAGQSVQGRVTGSPFDNIPPGGALGPLYSILNLVIQSQRDEIIPWSWYPWLRDRQLRALWKQESIISGGIYAMSGRVAALPYQIISPQVRVQARFQDMVAHSDLGEGSRSLFYKTCLDLLTTDNGAFWELLGAGKPEERLKGPVLGVAHLDSNMIWRTHDSEIPAIYINPYTGQYHGLHRSRIVRMSSMPQPDELARGVGFCAISRIERWIKIAYAEANYKDEKISGRFKRGIIYGSGTTPKQFDSAMRAVDQRNDAMGFTAFSGIPVLLTMQPDLKLDVLDLAKLPDGFDFEKEVTLYVYVVALGLGTDARELWPATASGATKADANTQHLKAQGKGIADILQTIEWAFNWYVLPPGVQFSFDFTDEEREMLQAEIDNTRANTLSVLSATGALGAEQVLNMAIHQEIVSLRALQTPAVVKVIASDEAPIDPEEESTPITPPPVEEPEPQPVSEIPQVEIAQKADGSPDKIISDFDKALQSLLDELAAKLNAGESKTQVKKWLNDSFQALLIATLKKAYSVGLNDKLVSDEMLSKLQTLGIDTFEFFSNSFVPDIVDSWDESEEEDLSADEHVDTYRSRLSMYSGAAWQAVWLGVADYTSQEPVPPRVMRVLDPASDHCDTCPGKAGIYDSFEDMESEVGIPGDLSDDCGSNCRCKILVETEPDSGNFVELFGYPDAAAIPDFEV